MTVVQKVTSFQKKALIGLCIKMENVCVVSQTLHRSDNRNYINLVDRTF